MNRIGFAIALVFAAPAASAQEGVIPSHVAARLGIAQETVRKVRELAFTANEELIGLEAELKRNQLALERQLHSESPEETPVFKLVENVGRAEAAVRKNRIGLMLRVRKALGADAWEKLEALKHAPNPSGPPSLKERGEPGSD